MISMSDVNKFPPPLPIGTFLMEYLPAFCWQDFQEIIKSADKYCETKNRYYSVNSMFVTISNLVKDGKVEARMQLRHGRGSNKRGFTYVYRKID